MSAALTFDNFAFSYQAATEAELPTERFAAQPNQNGRPLIGPLCTEIEEGSFTLITGTTGCGKTTLLRCCKPELAPNGTRTGSIKFFGQESSTLSVEESASTVGFVMQNPDNQLVCSEPWHELAFGLENLAVSQHAMRRRVAEIAHFFGMAAAKRERSFRRAKAIAGSCQRARLRPLPAPARRTHQSVRPRGRPFTGARPLPH